MSADFATRDGGHLPTPPDPHEVSAASRSVGATDGWTPLEFYAFIIRSVGIPASFRLDGDTWVADAPFTKPVPQAILDMLEAQGV